MTALLRALPADWLATFGHRVAVQQSGCWLWTGAVKTGGYGCIVIKRKSWHAHRLSWALAVGPIPPGAGFHGTCVCHRCDVRLCVNPAHLFLGTQGENIHDMERKRRGSHPRGSGHVNAKLTEESVRNIRALYCARKGSQDNLARQFGVSQRVISLVVRRLAWGHVP